MKNLVVLIGRIGKDPVHKEENHLSTFSMATEDVFKDREDEKKKVTTWHNVEVWNKDAMAKHLKSGMLIEVQGSIKNSSYEKQIGDEKVTMYSSSIVANEVLFLEPKK